MNAVRWLVALIIGATLAFAVPWATAESPPGAPDGIAPLTPGTPAPAAALTSDAISESASGATQEAAPPSPSGPTHKADPQPGSGPTHKADPQPASGRTHKADPQPGSGPTPTTDPQPASAPTPTKDPQPGSGATPEPSPNPGTGLTPDPPAPAPTGAAPTDGSGGEPCFLTSAGVACGGNPPCVVTTAGVTCATDCTITSAGFTCPPRGGIVPPLPPEGEVLDAGPVSGGPKPTPTRPVSDVEQTGAKGGEGSDQRPSAGLGQLPFTGATPLSLAVGCVLLASGLLLRRMTPSTTGPAVEPAREALPPAVPQGPSPRMRPLPSRGAIVLPSLVLLVCGVLLRRGTRR